MQYIKIMEVSQLKTMIMFKYRSLLENGQQIEFKAFHIIISIFINLYQF